MIKRNLPLIIIILLTILAGLGSILKQYYPVVGTVLLVFGILLASWKIVSAEIKNRYFEKNLEAQTKILASKGLGNVYLEMVESELKETGKSKQGIALLRKAHNLDPTDLEAIKKLSIFLALNVSFRGWATSYSLVKTQDDWKLAKQVAEKGLKINPRERILMDALGVLHDVAGDYEVARKWFTKSSKYRTDSYWHLLMATSWGLSGESSKAISEVEQAIKEGAKGWPVELAYGEALTSVGRCEEALYHLKQASQLRGWHPLISFTRLYALEILGRFSLSSIIDALYLTMLLLTLEPRHSLNLILKVNALPVFTLLLAMSKAVWSITSNIKITSKIHYKLFPPDIAAFVRGYTAVERGDIGAAVNFFEICHSICPKSVRVLSNLSICYALLKDRNKTIELINEAIEIEPDNMLLLWNKKQIESGAKLNIRFASKVVDDHIRRMM
jgi:tetratricopeptide (TPR) repeat protein